MLKVKLCGCKKRVDRIFSVENHIISLSTRHLQTNSTLPFLLRPKRYSDEHCVPQILHEWKKGQEGRLAEFVSAFLAIELE